MHKRWIIVVEAQSAEDAVSFAESVLDEHPTVYDYYDVEPDVIPATDPEFFFKLKLAMDEYVETKEEYFAKAKDGLIKELGENYTADAVFNFLADMNSPSQIRWNLRRALAFAENLYDIESGIMWDFATADFPYPTEDMIDEIKDNPSEWYIVEAILNF